MSNANKRTSPLYAALYSGESLTSSGHVLLPEGLKYGAPPSPERSFGFVVLLLSLVLISGSALDIFKTTWRKLGILLVLSDFVGGADGTHVC